MEEWRDVKGFEGLYQVSNLGRVKGLKSGVILSTKRKDGNGYPQSSLWKDGKATPIDNHILVARAFLQNPDNKPCIDHINGNKEDNRVENLRFVTYKENMANPVTYEKVKGANTGRKHTKEWKESMSKKMKEIAPFKGKQHSEEVKRTLSEIAKKREMRRNELGQFM